LDLENNRKFNTLLLE
jgi:hypothetical protein